MKIKELKHRSKDELNKMLGDLRSKLYDFRMDKLNAQLKNVKEVKECKKDISSLFLAISTFCFLSDVIFIN